MTAKPILRIGKLKNSGHSTPESVAGHLARSTHTPNADPQRTPLNEWLVGSAGMDLRGSIERVTRSAGIDPATLRKDATLANDVLLSISPEWFRPDAPEAHGTWDEARLRSFRAEAQAFLTKTFGARLVAATLHLDEATPHVQAVVVPVMKGRNGTGWRLSGRDMFDPARLASLQQAWEDRLRPHGVGPRTQHSRARHTTLRDYYGALEAARGADVREAVEISEPPSKPLLRGQEAHAEHVGAWRKEEAKRIREELRPLAREASRGRLYDAERRSGIEQRGQLADQAQALAEVRQDLAQAQRALELSKEEVAALRRTPIHEVAAMLGHTDVIAPRENAIDLVRRVGELDYPQAVAWLAQRFSPGVAATAVREQVLPRTEAAAKAAPVRTKGEVVKARAIKRQLDALAAPHYRLTIMRDVDGKRVGRNLGKVPDGPEHLFTAAEVVALVPRLTAENASGGNVFVTPLDPAAHHVLVDDLDAESLAALKERGYAPATVAESSPGNFQAVLKVPVAAAPKEAVNEWFKDLNRDLGDEKIVGLSHPFRLAAFENRKEKHRDDDGRFPFVRLVEATNRLCRRAIDLVRTYAARTQQDMLTGP